MTQYAVCVWRSVVMVMYRNTNGVMVEAYLVAAMA